MDLRGEHLYSVGMAISHSTNPNRSRNIFIGGIIVGIIATLIVSGLASGSSVSKSDIDKVNQRLDAIDQKLNATPTPAPAATAASGVTISSLNKDPLSHAGQSVSVTGQVSMPYPGIGFVVSDTDGSFFWVHTKDKIPSGTVTVKGTITQLKDQLTTWKNDPNWPADDTALTTKLRNEKVFIEAQSVS